MGSQAKPSTELIDCLNRLSATIGQLIRLLDALVAVTIGHESAKTIRKENTPIPDLMVQVLAPMLQAAGSSSHTLTQLSNAPGLQTRDCYSIVRSTVEISVNICYILAEGPSIAERALRHARQKAYQDLERESRISDKIIRVAYSSRPDPSSIEGLEADIAEFTSHAGREKSWVDLSIDERIKVAGQRFGDSVFNALHFARFMIYRHSSEILHGTLFSALYFFGLTTPTNRPPTLENSLESIGQQHMLILLATVLAANRQCIPDPREYDRTASAWLTVKCVTTASTGYTNGGYLLNNG